MPQRPYVVIEERALGDAVEAALVELGLPEHLATQVTSALNDFTVYEKVATVVAHNDRGALRAAHKTCYADTDAPVLAAVSERMFRPRAIPGRRQVSV